MMSISNKKKYLVFLCFLCVLWAQPLPAVEAVEVVTTIPVETTLHREGTGKAPDVWLEMVSGAEKSLDFAQFYLSNKKGEPLEPIIQAVIKAAERGVKVRFLVGTPINDDMEARTNDVLNRFKNHANIASTFFNWKSLNNGSLHAKYFIVDGQEVFVGSQNFDWRALKHIHETGLRIKNPLFASALTRVFEADWCYNSGDKGAYKKLKKQKPVVFPETGFLVASPEEYNPPGVKSALKTLIQLIDKAQKRITVQLLSFHEDIFRSKERFTLISDALSRAAERGVTVQMVVSDWNKRKPRVDDLKRLAQVPNLHIKFATIPQSKEGFIPYARVIHSKVMRIDDHISWVGTSNWAYSYFYKSRNVEVVTQNAAVAKTLDRLFNQLWNSSYTYPVEPKKEYTPPRIN